MVEGILYVVVGQVVVVVRALHYVVVKILEHKVKGRRNIA